MKKKKRNKQRRIHFFLPFESVYLSHIVVAIFYDFTLQLKTIMGHFVSKKRRNMLT